MLVGPELDAGNSYLTTDKDSHKIRAWHINEHGDSGVQENHMLDKDVAKSLLGIKS